MCSPTWKTYILSDMCSPTWETYILSDMCSPTWETYIPSDMCSPTQISFRTAICFWINKLQTANFKQHVENVYNTIHRISLYPLDSAIAPRPPIFIHCWIVIYPVDWAIQLIKNWGLVVMYDCRQDFVEMGKV